MTEGPIIQMNVVLFLRTRHITANGRDHESEVRNVARQRQMCHEAAEQMDAVTVKEYVEYGGTGPVVGRPVLCEMLDELEKLNVQLVLVANFDRIARSAEHMEVIAKMIWARGARLYTIEGWPGIDPTEPEATGWKFTPLDFN